MSALQPELMSNGTTGAPGCAELDSTASETLVINGSPRGFSSNSRVILSWMFPGVRAPALPRQQATSSEDRNDLCAIDLRTACKGGQAAAAFGKAKRVLLVFPLYTDSVPGLVKSFIEEIADAARAARISLKGKQLAFVVHSGFPESIQSEPCAQYLRRLCERWECTCLGVAIKGGSEGIRLMPANQKTQAHFGRLGTDFLAGRAFDAATIAALGHPRTQTAWSLLTLRGMQALKVANLYWIMMLRRHKAFHKRFDQPYRDAMEGDWQ